MMSLSSWLLFDLRRRWIGKPVAAPPDSRQPRRSTIYFIDVLGGAATFVVTPEASRS